MSATAGRTGGPRRRRRFSLNGLALQLSAFALSFTLVALLVVSGSQAAFVEENESVTNYVPIGAPDDDGPGSGRPHPAVPVPAPAVLPVVDPPVPTPPPVAEPLVAVHLTDSSAGSAMFTDAPALVPGVPLERCIEVTHEGGAGGPVHLYAARTAGDLAPYLDLQVDVGEGVAGSFGTCAGFRSTARLFSGTLSEFAARHADHGTGVATWQPTGERDVRSFRFSVAVRDEPAASGRSVSFGFTWETRGD